MTAEPPMKEIHPDATPRAKTLRLNRRKPSMGAGFRSSHQMKVASRATAPSSPSVIGAELHPARWPLLMVKRKRSNTPPDRAAPSQSNLGSRPSCCWGAERRRSRIIAEEAIAASPATAATKKTERHPSALTSTPPSAEPAITPLPTTLMFSPRALPRSLPGNTERTMAIPLPWTIAEPAP